MRFLNSIWSDLRERRLWPVVVVLALALVAVPVLLAKPAPKPAPLASTPAPVTPGPDAAKALPALSVVSVHDRHLTGPQRNPFSQRHLAKAHSASGNSSAKAGAGSTGAGSGAGKSSATPATNTTTTTPSPTAPAPQPAVLTETQSYQVALSITNSSGGFYTFDPLLRLSALPSARQPLLVELGVLQGGNRVLFVLGAGAIVHGPGSCVPGRLDCQVLELGQNQTETLWQQQAGTTQPVASFSVTGIRVAQYGSPAAALRARQAQSQVGASFLRGLGGEWRSLFVYRPGSGVVLDLRNLSVNVGGSR